MSDFYIDDFLKQSVNVGASDIHLRVGERPAIRVAGQIMRINLPPLTEEDLNNTINTISPEHLKDRITRFFDIDFSYEIPKVSRFRVNFGHQLAKNAIVFRVIPYNIKSFEGLNLPKTMENFADFNNGIVLVTGPTGSGKSTTIAALIDYINEKYAKHIITIEDPVEFIYTNKKSIVSQRQLLIDTPSFSDHTNDAVQTINRIVNFFEPTERNFVRQQLANTLRGTIAQKLVPTVDGETRLPAPEILVVTPPVSDFIAKDELEKAYELVKQGAYNNMVTMNMSLFRLYEEGKITKETALYYSDSKPELEQMMRGVYHGAG